jgi:choline dehydrogenase-like flavoprotein
MCHLNSAVVALSPKKNPMTFQKTMALNDFYFGASDSKYPLGHIQLLGKVKGAMLEGDAPFFTPPFMLDWMANHAIGWWITSEDLPDRDNRVLVDGDGRIHLHCEQKNQEAHRRLLKKLKAILDATGHSLLHVHSSAYLAKKIPLAGVAHQVGTLRFGNDPKTSVLNTDCRMHDVENLYVVDGSFFPSAGAVNPALTIIANAIRVGEKMIKEK